MFNLMKTAILMAAITALFMLIGRWLGGQAGMLLALVVAVGLNFFSYWFSDKIVLKMYNAREVDNSTAPQFVGMVRELAQRAGLPCPKVYLIDEDAPNAFATGRNPEHAAVAATTGIIRALSARELRGVMAPAIVALMVDSRMSRCLTCASSCAITPRNSRALSARMMPVVAATAACSGLRPVANAFGASSSIRYTLGIGRPARWANSRTMPTNCGAVLSSTSRALYIFSTILSENQ